MNHQAQLQALLANDPVRRRILQAVQELGLPDCWVAAGFVRSLVWDHLHQRPASPLPEDIDVIWFDPERVEPQVDLALEAELMRRCGGVQWSVKNQARMHLRNGDVAYGSAAEAMMRWPETATAVGARVDGGGEIEVSAPFGLGDLFGLMVRPTRRFSGEKLAVFRERYQSKRWLEMWPRLTVVLES
ncbi:nucleotidyltransferase family protein [Pseudomonas sp. NPDC089401]|uniref:nucleotidyltransferase family protein n=1 Tax=Pseudomonas sp. NPDC089401 TaxID=3364462 RepID=UPI00381A70BB